MQPVKCGTVCSTQYSAVDNWFTWTLGLFLFSGRLPPNPLHSRRTLKSLWRIWIRKLASKSFSAFESCLVDWLTCSVTIGRQASHGLLKMPSLSGLQKFDGVQFCLFWLIRDLFFVCIWPPWVITNYTIGRTFSRHFSRAANRDYVIIKDNGRTTGNHRYSAWARN